MLKLQRSLFVMFATWAVTACLANHASAQGLQAQYFNVVPANTNNLNPNFTSLSALQSHLATSGTASLYNTTTTLNFGNTGAGFPAPYNAGGANFESYYSGMMNIGTGGAYTFNTSTDDGSMIFIDGQQVVDNNNFQGVVTRSGTINLTAGQHNIVAAFYQGAGGYGMNAQFSGPDTANVLKDITTANATLSPDQVQAQLTGAGNIALTNKNLIFGYDNTSQTYSGVLSGNGGINEWGTGTQIITAIGTNTGVSTVAAGTLQLGNGASNGAVGGDIINNGALIFNNGSAQTNSGSISGTGSLTKQAAGTLTLGGSNTYKGATLLTAGSLVLTGATTTSGIYEGLVSNNNGFDTGTAIPFTSVQSTARYGSTTTAAQNVNPGNLNNVTNGYPNFRDNTTWGYTGYLNNTTSNSITYSFGKNFDDGTLLVVDGTTVINNNTNANATGQIALSPGLHKVEIRFGQGVGGVGPGGSYGNFGLGYNTVGNTGTGGTWNAIGTNDASTQFFTGVAGTPYSAVVMSGNTTLDVSQAGLNNVAFGSLADAGGSPTGHQVLIGANSVFTGFDNSSTTLTAAISGTGNLTKAGTGTFTLKGANTFSGNTNVNGGTLNLSNANALQNSTLATSGIVFDSSVATHAFTFGGLSGSGNIALTDNGANAVALSVGNNNSSTTYSGLLSGAGSLTKIGTGTLALTNYNNTYTGVTNVNGGTLVAGTRGLGSGAVNVGGSGTLSVNQTGSVGLAGLYFNGLNQNQANLASLGTLQASLATTAPTNVFNTTNLNFQNNGSGFPAPYNAGAPVFASYYSGMVNIGAAGAYTFNTSSDDGSMLYIDGNVVVTNNFNQGVTTKSGIVSLNAGFHNIVVAYNNTGGGYGMNAQISGANNVTMVDINTGNANAQITPDLVIASLAGSGNVQLTTGNLITGLDNTNTTFSGVMSGIGGLNKWGSGTLILTNANLNTGVNTVSGGTLQLGDGVSNNGSLAGNISTNSSLVFANPNAQTYGGTISGSGTVTKSAAGTLTLAGSNIYTGNTLLTAGTLKITGVSAAGLYEGLVNNTTGGDTTLAIPLTSVQATARWGSSSSSGGNNIYPSWKNDTTWGYTGYINNTTNAPITYNFGKNFDDNVYLKIDGVSVMSDTNCCGNATATTTLGPGIHKVDLRFGQGVGGVGPNTGAYGNFGLSYNTVGNLGTGGTWAALGTNDANTQFFASVAGAPTSAVVMSSNTTLDVSQAGLGVAAFGSLADAGGSPTGHQVLIGANTLDTGLDNSNTTLSAVISGTGNLIKSGTGTFTLKGANTFSGNTTVSAGTLNLANSLALQNSTLTTAGITFDSSVATHAFTLGGLSGSGNIALADNGANAVALSVGNNNSSTTYSGVLSGTGSLTKIGTGTLTVTTPTANTYTGGTNVNGGTLVAGSRGLGSGAVNVGGSGTLAVSQTGSVGLAGLYFNTAPVPTQGTQPNLASMQANFATLATSQVLNTTSLNFGGTGAGFPSPYNTTTATNFSAYYSGMLNIGAAGTYTFNTSTDDGSLLYIDGNQVVQNNFPQGVTTRTGSVALTTGFHNIVVAFNQGAGGYGMNAQISGANNLTMVDINTGNANAQITPDLVIASLSGSGNVQLSTGNLITGLDNTNTTFSGVMSGIGGLNKWGTGTLTLTGANLNTGATRVSGGTLQLGNGATNGSLNSDIVNTASVVFNDPTAVSNPGAISGTGTLTKQGAGQLSLGGSNTYSGNTLLTAGTLKITGAGVTSGIFEGLVSNSNAFDTATAIPMQSVQTTARWGTTNSAQGNNIYPGFGDNTTWGYTGYLNNTTGSPLTYNFGKNFDDNVRLVIDGNVILNSTNCCTLDPTVSATLAPGLHKFELRFGEGAGGVGPNIAGNPYGNFGLAYNSVGNTGTGGTWAAIGTNDANTQFLSGVPGAPYSAVTMSSNTTLDLSQAGLNNVAFGSLADAGGSPSGHQVLIGANTLYAGFNNTSTSLSAVISGTGNLVKAGSGTFTLAGSNTFSGNTSVNGGTLNLANTLALQNSTLTTGGITFDSSVGSHAFTLGGLSGAGNILLQDNASNAVALSIGNNNSTTTHTGVLSGSGSIIKIGSGTLTLTGANTYTGLTTVQTGTLKLQGVAFSTTARNYSIASGAVLNIDGNTGVATGTSTISGAGTLRVTGGVFGNEAPNAPVGAGRNINMNLGSNALIDIQAGAKLINGGWQNINWNSNLSDMNVDGTFDLWDGNTVFVDALTGGSTGNITAGIAGAGPQVITVGVDNGSGNYSGVLQNGARTITLTKNGSGTQILSGIADNGGLTATVTNGVLELAKTSTGSVHALGGGTQNVNSGGTLRLAGTGGDQIFDGATLNINSGGAFELNGRSEAVNTMSAAGTGVGGTGAILNTGASGSVLTGPITNNDFTVGGTGDFTIDGAISSASAKTLTKVGANTVTLSGGTDNAFLVLTVNNGAVVLNKASSPSVHAVGGGAMTINSGGTVKLAGTGGDQIHDASVGHTVNSGGTFDLNGRSETVSGIGIAGTGIGGNGALTNTGGATSTLTGTISNNTFTVGGTSDIIINGSVNNGNVLTKISNNALSLSGNTDNNALILDVQAGTVNLDKSVSGGVRAVAGISNIALGATVKLTGAGNDQIFGGGTGAQSLVNMSGGTLDLNGHAESWDRLTGTGTVTNTSGSPATMTMGENNGSSTYSGVINSTVAVTKVGTGTFELAGAAPNTHTGATNVNNGVLKISKDAALGATAQGTTVANGAALEIAGGLTYSAAEPLSINGAGVGPNTGAFFVDDGGASSFAGAITAATSATIGAFNSGSGNSTLTLSGVIHKNGTTLTIKGNGPGNVVNINGGIGPDLAANSDLVVDNVTTNVNSVINYNGPTFVRNAGVLNVNAIGSATTTAITVGDAGTGTVHQIGNVTVNGGTGVGNLTVTNGSYNLHSGTLNFGDYAAGGTAWTPAEESTISLATGSQFQFSGGNLQDVSTITMADNSTFTQNGGNFYIGQVQTGPAAQTTINGGFSLLAGVVHLDVFGDDLTPEQCCDGVASNNDQVTVNGDLLLDSVVSLDFVNYTPGFGDVLTLFCADTITLGDNFALDGGFYRLVPTGDPNHPFALQALVPEPASVAVWTLMGIVGFGYGVRRWSKKRRPRVA